MYLAKIAMDIVAKHKPADKDGVRIAELTEDSYKDLLWSHTPITDFWQIAHGIAGRLARYGIYTMGDIAEVSIANESLLYQIFGVNAELLIDHAWGIEPCTMKDIKNYHTGSHSISNGQVLPRAYSYDEAQLAIKEQAELLSLQMVKEKVTADSMTMYVGYEVCSPGYTGQYRIDCYGRKVPSYSGGTIRFGTFTNYSKQIIPAAVSLYQRIARPELKVRRIFLTVNNVRSEQDTWFQLDLFSDCAGMERQKRLEKAVLSIKSKYGPNAILRGISLCDGARTKERNTQIGGHKA
jgi:DNA polymerase V